MRINIYIPNEKRVEDKELQDVIHTSNKYAITKIETGGTRGGGADIVLIIQFILLWGSLEALKAYGKGFFGVDWFEKAGEHFRNEINDDLIVLKNYFKELYEGYISGKEEEKGAICVNDSTADFEIYIVLNLSIINQEMIKNLAEDLLRAKVFLSNFEAPINHNFTVQLFPNKKNNRWDYIFIPTVKAFGKFVDQYFSFEDNNFHLLKSNQEFRDTFEIGEDEKYKMLISPSQDRDFNDVREI